LTRCLSIRPRPPEAGSFLAAAQKLALLASIFRIAEALEGDHAGLESEGPLPLPRLREGVEVVAAELVEHENVVELPLEAVEQTAEEVHRIPAGVHDVPVAD